MNKKFWIVQRVIGSSFPDYKIFKSKEDASNNINNFIIRNNVIGIQTSKDKQIYSGYMVSDRGQMITHFDFSIFDISVDIPDDICDVQSLYVLMHNCNYFGDIFKNPNKIFYSEAQLKEYVEAHNITLHDNRTAIEVNDYIKYYTSNEMIIE